MEIKKVSLGVAGARLAEARSKTRHALNTSLTKVETASDFIAQGRNDPQLIEIRSEGFRNVIPNLAKHLRTF